MGRNRPDIPSQRWRASRTRQHDRDLVSSGDVICLWDTEPLSPSRASWMALFAWVRLRGHFAARIASDLGRGAMIDLQRFSVQAPSEAARTRLRCGCVGSGELRKGLERQLATCASERTVAGLRKSVHCRVALGWRNGPLAPRPPRSCRLSFSSMATVPNGRAMATLGGCGEAVFNCADECGLNMVAILRRTPKRPHADPVGGWMRRGSAAVYALSVPIAAVRST